MTTENKFMQERHIPAPGQATSHSQGLSTLSFRNYDLQRRIDVGGMGEVYLACQRTACDREVALKIIREDLKEDTTACMRFRREAEVIAHIKHEHILPLIEFGEEDGRLFLVTPYVAGGTLSQRLQNGPLLLSDVYQLFSALLRAVSYIHRRGVVHRDLKPSNILLDQEGKGDQVYVRLIDFGIASIQGMAVSPPLTTSSSEIMGTLDYMAPERLSGIAAPSNDIFSLGIILYQMLTGHLPKPGQLVTLPQPLEYVVTCCIAPRLEDRFATAEAVLEAFDIACQSLSNAVHHVQPSTSNHLSQPGRTHTPHPAHNPQQQQHPQGNILSNSGADFGHQDYGAPTVSANVLAIEGSYAIAPPIAAPGKVPRPLNKPGKPIITVVTLLPVLMVVAIASLLFFEFQPAAVAVATANINFKPQIHVIKHIFFIHAKLFQQAIDVRSASIPAKQFISSKSASQQGTTTGQSCVIFIFCHQTVSPDDEKTMLAQVRQKLVTEITQDLQQQIRANNVTPAGPISFTDVSELTNPQVGSDSKTVNVALIEQGSIEYFFNADLHALVQPLLVQQVHSLGTNYTLISSSIQMGQPVILSIDGNGVVSLKIAAGGVAQYQFPASQLQNMQSHLRDMKLKGALSYIQSQPGVDASTVIMHLSAGDTLPHDLQQIKVMPINPSRLPSIQLPT